MKSAFRALALGALLLLPISAAFAQAPSITEINDLTLNANGTMTVSVVAVDVNGDPITLSSTLPGFATLNDPTFGTGVVVTTMTLSPSSTDVGTYNGSITALAGGQTDLEQFSITVNAAGTNSAPVVTAPAIQTVTEGQLVTFIVTASDAEDIQLFNASGVPPGATFTTNAANTSGTFLWTPTTDQAGQYDATFTASNPSGTGSASTHFVVLDLGAGENECPTITLSQSTLTVTEGQSFSFNVTVSDPDGGNVDLASPLVPSGATFTDNNNNVGTLSWTPSSTQAGTYAVTFVARDNEGCVRSATLMVTVTDVPGGNDCPTITAPATQSVNEGQALSFNVTTTDPDGDTVTLSATGVPSGADFNTSTGAFTWAPNSTQSGTYTVTFTANDGQGCTQTATTVITVNDVTGGNDCPTITAPATRSVNEGQALSFNVTTTDPDGDTVTLSATGVPSGANFNTSTGAFSWTPNSTQSGTYSVTFTANDGQGCTQTATTVITVNDVTGGGTVDATATLSGKFHTKKKFICFKVHPVNGSFDVRNVMVGSIVLRFDGNEAQSLSGKTHIAYDCDDDGDDDGDDCDECGDDDEDDPWDHDEDCDHEDDDDDDGDNGDCVATHVRACFSAETLRDLFGEDDFGDELDDATIVGQLTTGQMFIATVDDSRFAGGNNHGKKGNHGLKLKASPNPLNPKTQVTFMLSRAGRVQIAIYDLKGRLVKTLLDENRGVGANSVLWDGTDSRSGKVASGVYFFKIRAPQGQEVLQLTVLK